MLVIMPDLLAVFFRRQLASRPFARVDPHPAVIRRELPVVGNINNISGVLVRLRFASARVLLLEFHVHHQRPIHVGLAAHVPGLRDGLDAFAASDAVDDLRFLGGGDCHGDFRIFWNEKAA